MSITIPNDRFIRVALFGQLVELTESHNWETHGDLDAETTVALMQAALETLSFVCLSEVPAMIVFAYRTSIITVSSGVFVQATALTTTPYDTGQWNATEDRVDIDADGLYLVQGFAGVPLGPVNLTVEIRVNGTASRTSIVTQQNSGVPIWHNPLWVIPLSAGDALKLWVRQHNTIRIDVPTPGIGLLVARFADLP